MTPLRAKYIRDLVIHGRSKHTQEAFTRYVCDLARYYRRSPELISYEQVTGWLSIPQGAPTVFSLQRQHRRQRRALSLRRYTWARDAPPDGIGLKKRYLKKRWQIKTHGTRTRVRSSCLEAGIGNIVGEI